MAEDAGGAPPKRMHMGILAGVGALIAEFADMGLRPDVSSVLKIAHNLDRLLNIPYANAFTVILVIAIAAILGIYFATNPKEALVLGIGIISFLINLVPASLPTRDQASGTLVPLQMPAVHGLFQVERPLYAQGTPASPAGTAPARVSMTFKVAAADGGRISSMLVVVRDSQKVTIAKARYGSATFRLEIPPGRYRMEIQAENYAILQQDIEVSRPQEIALTLQPSGVPSILQQILKK